MIRPPHRPRCSRSALRLGLLLTTALCGGIISSSLPAQPGDVPPAPPARTFRVICGGNWSEPPVKYDLNTKPVTLEIGRSLSPAYICPAQTQLTLYNELPPPADAAPGTKPKKQTLATLTLPADQTKSLVVLVPDVSGKISFRTVPDDFKKHPGGTLRVLNFSSFPAAVAINDQQYMAPLEAPEVIVPFSAGGTLIQSAIQQSGKWISVYRRERIARPRLHTYGFIFNFISEIGAKDETPPPTSFILFGEIAPPADPTSPALTALSSKKSMPSMETSRKTTSK